ncbi:MAG TPA: hypothetical protein VGE97_09430 [Nitrososphaera sp.]|jgi:hypothetical protein
MTLDLDSNVVYAILATIVAVVLIVKATTVIRLYKRPSVPNGNQAKPYDQSAWERTTQ